MPKQLSKDEFVAKARAVHGEWYDYSETEYLPAPQKIAIRCPEHGVFVQKAGQHLIGKGCPACGGVVQKSKARKRGLANAKWDTDSLRKKVSQKHPGLDLSQLIYTRNNESGTIICPLHGTSQVPFVSLLNGRGCRRCVYGSRRPRIAREEWLSRFALEHGERYDYSQLAADVFGSKQIAIICRQHGVFLQRPDVHAAGGGCQQCALSTIRTGIGAAGFLKKFYTVHGSLYSYDLLPENFTSKTHLSINCPKHGVFHQSAFMHSVGQGCPKCGRMRIGRNSPGWRKSRWVSAAAAGSPLLYCVRLYNSSESFYKVGITFRSIKRRFFNRTPYDYEVVSLTTLSDAATTYDTEQEIHKIFRHLSIVPGQPFDGCRECYSSIVEILSFIKEKALLSPGLSCAA